MAARVVAVLLAFALAAPRGTWAGPEGEAARLGERLDALEARIPPTRYDAAALAASLGKGIEPAFGYLRDRVGFDAYDGVLRGARGTLVHGAGNALDRALLLAALLDLQGVPTRLVTGRLDEATCERLLHRLFARPETAAPAAESDFAKRVRERGRRDAAAIRGAVGAALGADAPSTRAAALRSLAAHAWVQARQGEAWVDLDPSLPDATVGRAPAASDVRVHQALPDDLHQTIAIRVLAESLSGGSLATEKALEYVARVADLRDALVYLVHVPPRPSGPDGAIATAVAGQAAWAPALWIEGESFGVRAVAFDDGTAKPRRGLPPSGGLGGAFGPGGALGSSRALVAEWLEIEVRVPGREPEVVRRALLDRAPPGWREAAAKDPATLAPLARVGGELCAPREVHNLWITTGRHDLGAFLGAVRTWGAPEDPAAATREGGPSFVEGVWGWSLQNALLALFSDEVLVPSLDRSERARFLADSPRVALVSAGPTASDGAEGARFRVDLLRDPLAGVARTAADEGEVVAGKVLYGATQGALEHETCAGLARALGLAADGVRSTSAFLPDAGPAAVVAEGATRTFADGRVAARAGAEARGGTVLVVPAPVFGGTVAAWWRVAPDGTTSAVLEDGNAGTVSGGVPPFPLGRPLEGPGRPVVRPGSPTRLWPPPSDVGPFDRLKDPWHPDPKKRNRTAGQEYLMTLSWIAAGAAFAAGMGYLLAYMPGVEGLVLDIWDRLQDALPG